MSSGFVSGGTIDDPVERDDEWLKAEGDLERERRQKAEAAGQANTGKSLYEVLQENKAAKQEAFQESIRLKNQFRTLDEDEVEFLDSVLESTRAQEAAVTKETMEQLEIFHRQREEAAKAEAALNATAQDLISPEEQEWKTSHRKRRRKEKEPLAGAKLRKRSTDEINPTNVTSGRQEKAVMLREPECENTSESLKPPAASPPGSRGAVDKAATPSSKPITSQST
ncbi:hypothetical protein KEM54_003381, partial [Ascosphaera aggregata]